MSIESISWALDQENFTMAQKLTLIVIAEAAKDHKGTNIYTSWLAVQTIAKRGSMGRNTVFRALADLVKLKKISISNRKNNTSIYTLLGDIGAHKYKSNATIEVLNGGTRAVPPSTRAVPPSTRAVPTSTRAVPLEVPERYPNLNKPINNPINPEANLVRPAFTRHQSTETRAEQDAAYMQQMRDLGWDPNTMAPIADTEVN